MIAIIIALTTTILMVLSVLFKPRITIGRVNVGLYWLICLIGAVFMLIFGDFSLSFLAKRMTADTSVNPIKILTLFLSMTLLSVFLGDAGFFYLIADKVFARKKGGQKKLFLLLYFSVAILTIFTSNDIIILTLTPPICIFCKKAKISPIPYLLGEFVCANTWSNMLIIGNPTNVYLAQSAGIGFIDYMLVMALPALVCGLTSLAVLLLLFRKQLSIPFPENQTASNSLPIDKTRMTVALIHLGVCLILLTVADFIGLEMWLICLALCLSLIIFNLIYGLIKDKNALKVLLAVKKAPYELIPFVLSMFTIVCGLECCGATNAISSTLVTGKKIDALTFAYISTLSANLLNNIPMSVLFSSILGSSTSYALFGTIIGSNVGAFLTPVGALAGIMWSRILLDYDINLPFYKFIAYGLAVAIPTLALSSLTLFITL